MTHAANPPIRVTVYCAASPSLDKKYYQFAEALGNELVSQGMELVYGGGGRGLMGALADAVLNAGGKVRGVIPNFMIDREWAHPKVKDLELVNTMHERKPAMVAQCDAIVALPGGCGTFEELLEAFTWKRLDLIDKPIVVVNQDGYYNGLKALFDHSVQEGFMAEDFLDYWQFVTTPKEAVEHIDRAVHR